MTNTNHTYEYNW